MLLSRHHRLHAARDRPGEPQRIRRCGVLALRQLRGLRGLEFYTQRVAIQGDSGVLGKVLGIPAE